MNVRTIVNFLPTQIGKCGAYFVNGSWSRTGSAGVEGAKKLRKRFVTNLQASLKGGCGCAARKRRMKAWARWYLWNKWAYRWPLLIVVKARERQKAAHLAQIRSANALEQIAAELRLTRQVMLYGRHETDPRDNAGNPVTVVGEGASRRAVTRNRAILEALDPTWASNKQRQINEARLAYATIEQDAERATGAAGATDEQRGSDSSNDDFDCGCSG